MSLTFSKRDGCCFSICRFVDFFCDARTESFFPVTADTSCFSKKLHADQSELLTAADLYAVRSNHNHTEIGSEAKTDNRLTRKWVRYPIWFCVRHTLLRFEMGAVLASRRSCRGVDFLPA